MPITIHKKHQDALGFLKSHPVGTLATVDPNGNPHAAAIYFTVDSNSNIFFITKTGTKKADNLERNDHAVLLVFDAKTQTTVQATGTALKLTDPVEMNTVFATILSASLTTTDNTIMPISKLREGDYVAYKLTPKQIRMAVFSQPKFGKYDDIFKTSMPKAT